MTKKGLVRITDSHSMAPYQKEIAIRVLDAVSDGKTMTEIANMEGMPTRMTLYRWLTLYRDFNKAYWAAKELSAMALEEEALDIARRLEGDNTFTGTRIQALKEAMVQFRWSAARRDPKRYGGNAPVTNVTVPVQINTSLDLAADAPDGASGGYTFTATVIGQTPCEDGGAGSEDGGGQPTYDPNEDGEVVDNPDADPYDTPEDVGPVWTTTKKVGAPVGHPSYNTRTNTARRREVLKAAAQKRAATRAQKSGNKDGGRPVGDDRGSGKRSSS